MPAGLPVKYTHRREDVFQAGSIPVRPEKGLNCWENHFPKTQFVS
jgi:hypothetical protein